MSSNILVINELLYDRIPNKRIYYFVIHKNHYAKDNSVGCIRDDVRCVIGFDGINTSFNNPI